MSILRLLICVTGVYSTFLLWAIAQERLSTRFPSTNTSFLQKSYETLSGKSPEGDPFPSPIFLNFAQALASCISSATYLIFTALRSGNFRSMDQVLGLETLWGTEPEDSETREARDGAVSDSRIAQGEKDGMLKDRKIKLKKDDGRIGSHDVVVKDQTETPEGWRQSLIFLLLRVSISQTLAGPIGFMALRHISYPTMVLGKSCKLIPVLLLNVLLYRRHFSLHKYLVVALVTTGISVFMLAAPVKPGKGGGSDSMYGLGLLVFNLLIDGLTNSTQDQIFKLYPKYKGQQMMFHMALLSQLMLLPLILLPLPNERLSFSLFHTDLDQISWRTPAAIESIEFLITHPTALAPLLTYAILGGLGQLFIFETIKIFGSLTLTMITVTRKLFTMLLSVIVFKHDLTPGQWTGVGIVFAGIGVEARMKRKDIVKKAKKE